MFRSIVVGVDGSETSESALRRAAELARLCSATLHVVTGYRDSAALLAIPGDPAAGYLAASGRVDETLRVAAESIVARAAQEHAQGVEVRTHTVAQEPSEAILDVAEKIGADLIVVGNKGMQGARRFLLGSVPNRVAHHAPCTVMIVRTT